LARLFFLLSSGLPRPIIPPVKTGERFVLLKTLLKMLKTGCLGGIGVVENREMPLFSTKRGKLLT
jgi:hypothetical protein